MVQEIIIPRYVEVRKAAVARPRLSASVSEEELLVCRRTRLQRLTSAGQENATLITIDASHGLW